MLSAVIPAQLSYPAVARAGQLGAPGVGPSQSLVLRKDPINVATTMADRDRPAHAGLNPARVPL